jgi:hypothetical protein
MNRYLHQLRRTNDRITRRGVSFREAYQTETESKGLIDGNFLENSIVYNSEGIEFCVVCQDDIFLDVVRKLSCKHVFHINCIEKWFVTHNICPTCKRQF